LAFRAALIAFLLVAVPVRAGDAEGPSLAQERVKAAFVYKFASYVEWPADAFPGQDSPLVIGVAGADELFRELQAIEGRRIVGRPLQVREVKSQGNAADCCQILYVGTTAGRERTAAFLAAAKTSSVLTVTDSSEHPADSVINFLVVDNRIRFDISRDSAERKGLQLRSQLLAVARQLVTR
jgi:hypothetical protein